MTEEERELVKRALAATLTPNDRSGLISAAIVFLGSIGFNGIGSLPEHLRFAARQLSAGLAAVEGDWRTGLVEHVEDSLNWKRTKKWRRSDRKRFTVGFAVAMSIRDSVEHGTPYSVARDQAAHKFHISASAAEKYYYDLPNWLSKQTGIPASALVVTQKSRRKSVTRRARKS
jgi:hypothetical protein